MKTLMSRNGFEIMLDDEDFDELRDVTWTVDRGYALTTVRAGVGKSRKIYLHRLLMKAIWAGRNVYIDHADGNPLNNQKANLRICSVRENCKNSKRRKTNTSGYKGVHLHAPGVWRARIAVNRKNIHLGCFPSPEKAYEAYCEAALQYHQEYARLK